ncbi:hypothetical protein J1N35_022217 [Gossypium stocksii]|uniref:Uncharacterized protein n=1 Tax=Gossypium stocksii TaxID=47602 RepID=A0A9D3VGS3_9ROSI|nr:hypothetical protein J1N35_022217 [Gossypium stocksii]
MEKGSASGEEMATMTTGFEHVTTTPKFKRRNVSTVRDFLPGCEREATTDLGLHRQIAVDQGKYSLSITEGVYIHFAHTIDRQISKSRNAEIEKPKVWLRKSCECMNTRMRVIDALSETP